MENQSESSTSSFAMTTLLVGVVLPPLLCVIVLFTTDFYVTVGRAVGVNLPDDENLIIYDALCWQEGAQSRINVVYWSKDSAPMSATLGDEKSPTVNAVAGINTIEVILKEQDTCPDSVVLTDESRNRTTGGSVEVLNDDE